MRRVIHKLFFIWELEKEQAWINEMASHGYALEHAGRFSFTFDETEPDRYTYKTLFLKGWGESAENIKYFKFLEEMGIKVVCYINYPGTTWVYTRALKEDYPDGIEIFSDIDSTIGSHKVFGGYMIFVAVLTLLTGVLNLWIAFGGTGSGFMPVNFLCALLMLILSGISIGTVIKIFVRISRLKKERAIHE